MRTRSHIAAVLCAAAFAAGALATSYTWTGNIDSDWDNEGNWYAQGFKGYPDDPNDDATFPVSANEYSINLVTLHIQDLEIWETYEFAAAAGSPVLQVEEFTICATDEAVGEVVVTITGAEIRTHQ